MGSVADCFDNALAESLFASLECESSDQQPGARFETRREAKLAVFDYLEALSRDAGDPLGRSRWARGTGYRIDRGPVVSFIPCLLRTARPGGGDLIRLGHPLLDVYLDLVSARARTNTLLATAFDLKVFFSVIDKDPGEVVTADVLAFIKAHGNRDSGTG